MGRSKYGIPCTKYAFIYSIKYDEKMQNMTEKYELNLRILTKKNINVSNNHD